MSLGSPVGRLALGVETVPRRSGAPDRRRPGAAAAGAEHGGDGDAELLAVALAYEPPGGGPRRRRALLREEPTPAAEVALLRRTVAALREHDPETVVTFDGERRALALLRRRPVAANDGPLGHGLAADLDAALARPVHRDLRPAAWAAHGAYTDLETLCDREGVALDRPALAAFDHGLDLAALRPAGARSPYAESGDLSRIGERWLRANGAARRGPAGHRGTGGGRPIADGGRPFGPGGWGTGRERLRGGGRDQPRDRVAGGSAPPRRRRRIDGGRPSDGRRPDVGGRRADGGRPSDGGWCPRTSPAGDSCDLAATRALIEAGALAGVEPLLALEDARPFG